MALAAVNSGGASPSPSEGGGKPFTFGAYIYAVTVDANGVWYPHSWWIGSLEPTRRGYWYSSNGGSWGDLSTPSFEGWELPSAGNTHVLYYGANATGTAYEWRKSEWDFPQAAFFMLVNNDTIKLPVDPDRGPTAKAIPPSVGGPVAVVTEG